MGFFEVIWSLRERSDLIGCSGGILFYEVLLGNGIMLILFY